MQQICVSFLETNTEISGAAQKMGIEVKGAFCSSILVTFSIFPVAKELLVVVLSVAVNGDELTLLNWLGCPSRWQEF